MSPSYFDLTFTTSVKAAQTRYGSRKGYLKFDHQQATGPVLGKVEAAFIEARDSFYQATVNEDGWPYIQHRGGPVGFLNVLDTCTIAYADFHGNKQYLSVGNLTDNERISLILMDYPNRRRLKVLARAKIVHEDEDPDLIARLTLPNAPDRIERAVVMTVEAVDWNCPKYIARRFDEVEVERLMVPLVNRIKELEENMDFKK